MAAISAIQHDAELKAKYEQKVKEGKHKMSVINIIKAKLIERVFAVIKKQKAYEIRLAPKKILGVIRIRHRRFP